MNKKNILNISIPFLLSLTFLFLYSNSHKRSKQISIDLQTKKVQARVIPPIFFDNIEIHKLKRIVYQKKHLFLYFELINRLLEMEKFEEALGVLSDIPKQFSDSNNKDLKNKILTYTSKIYLSFYYQQSNNCDLNSYNLSAGQSYLELTLAALHDISEKDAYHLDLIQVIENMIGSLKRNSKNLNYSSQDRTDLLEKSIYYEDNANKMGVDICGSIGGVIMDDFNNDSYLDLVIANSNGETPLVYFQNKGDGTFLDLTNLAGLEYIKGSFSISQLDYNNDGFLDISIQMSSNLSNTNPIKLLKNNGLRNQNNFVSFTEVNLANFIEFIEKYHLTHWTDIDNDGWLDLLLSHSLGNHIFLNDTNGGFKKSNINFFLNYDTPVILTLDHNKDNLIDFFDSNNNLIINKGKTKNKHASFYNIPSSVNSNFVGPLTFGWSWDFDNSGFEDIFLTSLSYKFFEFNNENEIVPYLLFKDTDNKTYKNVDLGYAYKSNPNHWISNFGDFNNDGFQDIFLGHLPNLVNFSPCQIFFNHEGNEFVKSPPNLIADLLPIGGISIGDIDNDGDQDIYLVNGSVNKKIERKNRFYINPGNDNNWVVLKLEGVNSNRAAIGTLVELSTEVRGKEQKIYRRVGNNSPFGGNSLQLEIGIGKATSVKSIKIYWTVSKQTQTISNLKANQFYYIKENELPLVSG